MQFRGERTQHPLACGGLHRKYQLHSAVVLVVVLALGSAMTTKVEHIVEQPRDTRDYLFQVAAHRASLRHSCSCISPVLSSTIHTTRLFAAPTDATLPRLHAIGASSAKPSLLF